MGDRLLHHPRRLHDLGEEHAAAAEQVADDVHAGHQRALDHVERPDRGEACLLDVVGDEVGDAVHQRVREALFDGELAPRQIRNALLALLVAVPLGQGQQALGPVGSAVEHDVLAGLLQFRIEVVVHGHLAGVDDAHVHPGADGVEQEHGVHRLADRLVAAERERQVRHTARHVREGEMVADPARRLDERQAVTIVLFDAGGDGEDVGVEDDVLGREPDLVDQDVVRPLADRRLALERVGLALLVERHHDHRRAVGPHDPRLADERLLALLHRDRVDDRLALDALQPGLDHRELRRVDHDRHARDVGLGRDQVEERHHRRLGVEQPLVHVDVDDLRAVLDLVARDLEGGVVVATRHQLAEAGRSRHVGALADVHERDVAAERERLEPGQVEPAVRLGHASRWLAGDRGGDGADVLGCGAAAPAGDVDQTGVGELAELGRHELGRLVVVTELVGETGVGVGAHERVGVAPDVGDVGPHLGRTQRAVEADRERCGVPHRMPERGWRLPGEQPTRPVGDRAGDHDRDDGATLRRQLGDGVDRGLGVERVEDRLDQQHVDRSVEQPTDLLGVRRAQVVERHGPEAGIRHVRRDRRRPVRRSDGAGDEPPPPVFAFGHQGGVAGDGRAGAVEVVGELAHAVVGLRDRGRRERVRRHDVGARSEVGVVDAADRVRLGDVEQVVVAVDGAVPRVELGAAVGVLVEPETLDHGAHRAVEDEDPFRRSLAQRADAHAGTASSATLVCTVEGWASGWTSSRRQIE